MAITAKEQIIVLMVVEEEVGQEGEEVSRTWIGENPLNSYGKISKCAVCQSIYHYARDFPYSDSNKSQENKVTLSSQEAQKCFLQNVLRETLNLAVLDKRCTNRE